MAFSEFDIHTHMFTFSSQDFLLRFGNVRTLFFSLPPARLTLGFLSGGLLYPKSPKSVSKKDQLPYLHPGTARGVVHLILPTYRRQGQLALLLA